MSQHPTGIVERLRRAISPSTHDEREHMTEEQDRAACERDRAEELFKRLRGSTPSRRPSWESIAGIDGGQEQRG